MSIIQVYYYKKTNIQLSVVSGTNLVSKDTNGKSDPFVVVNLVTADKVGDTWKKIKLHHKTKTKVVPKTLDPEFNFQFSL